MDPSRISSVSGLSIVDSGQFGSNSQPSDTASSYSRAALDADVVWDELDDDDVVVLVDIDEEPEEFDEEVDTKFEEVEDDDVMSDLDAALAAETPQEL